MYISKIVINNYRCFQDFKMKLKPMTLIVGENNIGKSNLLDAIGLVLNKEISYFKKRSLSIEDFNFSCIDNFRKSVVRFINDEIAIEEIEFPDIRIDLYLEDFTDEQFPIVSHWLIDDTQKVARISYIFSNRNPKKNEYLTTLKSTIDKVGEIGQYEQIEIPINDYSYDIVGGYSDKRIDNYYYKMLKMEYLDAMRDAQRQLGTNSEHKLLYKILLNRELDKFYDLKEKVQELDQIINESQEELKFIKGDIKEILDLLSLETQTSTNDVNFRFTSIEVSEILKKISLEFGDTPVSIDRNGLGRNNLLYISVVMSFLNRRREYFRLIGIEEPEAHLSPILQKHLSENLSKESKKEQQIIITSHSSHIVNHIDLDNTAVLFKTSKGRIESHYLLESFNDTAVDKKTIRYLKRWLDASQSTLLFTRRLVLVEGIAEMTLIPEMFKLYTEASLEKFNCQVINVNGVAFKHFLKLVNGGYFIKTVVITDSDKGKKTEKRAPDLKEDYSSDYIDVFYTTNYDTFEKELIDANKDGEGKKQILSTLKETRPRACGLLFDKEYKTKSLDVEKVFEKIDDYKAEFAFNLSEDIRNGKKITIPKYIEDAFDFLIKKE